MKQKMSPSHGIAKKFAKRGERMTAKRQLHKKTRQANRKACSNDDTEIDVPPKWIW